MTHGRMRLAVEGGIARLTFDHPRRLNAITAAMWRELAEMLERIEQDPAARVLLLDGAGERAFCTGNDISEFETLRSDPEAAARYNELQHVVADRMRGLTKPAIAAIHGHCLGAGLEIALLCDLRLCSAEASMGVPAVKLGLPYRAEDIIKLLDVVGEAAAREMVLLGRRHGGADILRLGLVHRLLPDQASLRAEAEAMAAELARNAPLSLAAAKVAFRELARRDGPPDLRLAQAWADRCYASADYAEGRRAKMEKRAPDFTGR
ncbi:enoyl-CoA hydratase-related protein [Falsiroseomonas oryzae]|uniref:enoyl-CoA hydratase-related protein n=1 Tax=Falsiroseomonas oryzae TaxID=2766473 RepID=UPI0022EA75DD|nr:enoyl-CoA hydratase-related protein [Roseomonas sp. MO-31]